MPKYEISTPREGSYEVTIADDGVVNVFEIRDKKPCFRPEPDAHYPINYLYVFFKNKAIQLYLTEFQVKSIRFRTRVLSPFNYHEPCLSFCLSKSNADTYLFLSKNDKGNVPLNSKFWLLEPNQQDIDLFNQHQNPDKRREVIRGKMTEVTLHLHYRKV